MTTTSLPRIGAVAAMLALIALAPFYLASGLMAPPWAIAVLVLVWLVLFGLGCAWFRRRPLWILAHPLIAPVVWFGGLGAGEAWLEWTA